MSGLVIEMPLWLGMVVFRYMPIELSPLMDSTPHCRLSSSAPWFIFNQYNLVDKIFQFRGRNIKFPRVYSLKQCIMKYQDKTMLPWDKMVRQACGGSMEKIYQNNCQMYSLLNATILLSSQNADVFLTTPRQLSSAWYTKNSPNIRFLSFPQVTTYIFCQLTLHTLCW